MTVVALKKVGDGPLGVGEIRVFERPVTGATYILGADVAQGATFGSANMEADESTVTILRRQGMQVVQVLEAAYRCEIYVFGEIIAALGAWYNHAIVNVERNMAHAVVPALKSVGYPQERWYIPPIQASTVDLESMQWFFHKNKATQLGLLHTLISYMDPEAPRVVINSKRCLDDIGSLQKDARGGIATTGKDFTIALSMAVIVDATTQFDVELLDELKKQESAPYGVDADMWNEKHGIKKFKKQEPDEAPDWEGSSGLDWGADWGEKQ